MQTIEETVLLKLKGRSFASGELIFPCIPSMFERYMGKIEALLQLLEQQITPQEMEQLRQMMKQYLTEGFQASPYSWLVIKYGSSEPKKGLRGEFKINLQAIVPPPEKKYDMWPETRKEPLFGSHPDAKLISVASTISDPANSPVLDIGAGTGRNSLPLARRGHPVDALELNAVFADKLLQSAATEQLPLVVTHGDVLHPNLQFRPDFYKLVVASELVTDLKSVEQVRSLFSKVAPAIEPGGSFLFNCFLMAGDDLPSQLLQEISVVYWSFVMTREQLKEALAGLPLEIVSDESMADYEKAHLPPQAWPPTNWYLDWAKGRDIYPSPERLIMELCWILCRRV